jgi:hypothetical protein
VPGRRINFRLVSHRRRSWLNELRNRVEPIFRNRLHSHFTDHSIVHCDRVAALAEQLLVPLKRKLRLNDDEATVLYSGCYLHDIGMHNEKAGESGRLAKTLAADSRTWADVPHEERLDLIRRNHHEISADMVFGSIRAGEPPISFTLTEEDFPGEIAAICEAHCVDTESPRYEQLTRKDERPTMRLRLVSAILRLADILDEAHHRALVEQARTLDLNLESRMHWWRHYYTRSIDVETEKNRITVWFSFPCGKEDEYKKLVPPLQMPWVERELSRHRAVLAENGLSWHIGWQVRQEPFSTLQQMPAEVEGYVYRELARQKHISAQRSRVDLLKHFQESRRQLVAQLRVARDSAESTRPDQYLNQVAQLAEDLWRVGSHLTARHWLQSALFFTTSNGRGVPASLQVRAATDLARMQAADGDTRGSVVTLLSAQAVADGLADTTSQKRDFYQALSSLALAAGAFQQGVAASQTAMKLFGPSENRDRISAELAEATLLEGNDLLQSALKGTG